MSLFETIRAYFRLNRSVRAYEVDIIKQGIKSLNDDLVALNRKLGALEAKQETLSPTKLLEHVNGLRAQVDKLTARLVGYSKSGIS